VGFVFHIFDRFCSVESHNSCRIWLRLDFLSGSWNRSIRNLSIILWAKKADYSLNIIIRFWTTCMIVVCITVRPDSLSAWMSLRPPNILGTFGAALIDMRFQVSADPAIKLNYKDVPGSRWLIWGLSNVLPLY
jgi:hypothetical protein